MSRIYLSPPDVGAAERELLLDAFDSNWIAPLGPHVDAFEREFAAFVGVPYAVALSSGTAALHLSLLALGIKAGDEVLVSTLTFAATANAVIYVGAVPVFIDVSPETWTMNPDLLDEELARRAARGRLPAAVIAVDLYGQCCDYARIAAACEQYGVPLVEDAAEALGGSYGGRSAGAFGECAAFSFNGNKIITTSGGGMSYFFGQAHNDYLQLAAEGGILVTVPALVCLVVFVRDVRRSLRGTRGDASWWLRAGAVASLIAIGFQETVDFSLQMPGNAALFAAVCAVALHAPSSSGSNLDIQAGSVASTSRSRSLRVVEPKRSRPGDPVERP